MTSEGQWAGQPAEATSGDGFPPDTDGRRTPGRASVPADDFPHSYGPPPQATPNGGSPFVVPAVPPFGQAATGGPADRYGVPPTPPGPSTGSARVPQGSARVPQPAAPPPSMSQPPGPPLVGQQAPSGQPGDDSGALPRRGSATDLFRSSAATGAPASAGFPAASAPQSAWAPPEPSDSHPYRGQGESVAPPSDQQSDFDGYAAGSPTRGRLEPEPASPAEAPSSGRPPGLSAFGDQRIRVPGATLTGLPDAPGPEDAPRFGTTAPADNSSRFNPPGLLDDPTRFGGLGSGSFPTRDTAGGTEIVDRTANGAALPRRVASDDPTGFGAPSQSGNSGALPRHTEPEPSRRRLTTDLPIRSNRPATGDAPSFGGRATGGEPMFGSAPSPGRPFGADPAESNGPSAARPAFGEMPFGDQPAQPSFGDQPGRGAQPSFGDQPPFGDQPERGAQSPFGQQPAWGESASREASPNSNELPRRGDPAEQPSQAFGGSPAARQDQFGGSPFGTSSPGEEPTALRSGPSALGGSPAARQDPFGRAEPFSDAQQDPFGRAEPSATRPEQRPGSSSPYGGPSTGETSPFGATPTSGPSAFSGPTTGDASPFGGPTSGPSAFDSPTTSGPSTYGATPTSGPSAFSGPTTGDASPFGGPTSGPSAFGGSPAAQPEPRADEPTPFGPASAFGGSPAAAQQSPAYGSGIPGRPQAPEVRRSTAYGTPAPTHDEPGDDEHRSPFGATTPGAGRSLYGSPPQSTDLPGADDLSRSPYPPSSTAGQSPYAPSYDDSTSHSPFPSSNDGMGQSPYPSGNDGAGQSPYAPGNDSNGQSPYGQGTDGSDSPYRRVDDRFGPGSEEPADSPYGRPQIDSSGPAAPYGRRPSAEDDESDASAARRSASAPFGPAGMTPESRAGVPAPRGPADAGGPAKGTARPVSASASVPMASRVGPAEGEELPAPAQAPQARVYGRPVQPPEDDEPASAPVSPFARPGGARYGDDQIGGDSQDLPPLGPKTPPPGGHLTPPRASASARVAPTAPGQDGTAYGTPARATPPDTYGENTTDMAGRNQPPGQPYVPAPALPSMHSRPPLADGFPPAPGAEEAAQQQSGLPPARPRLGGVFPGPGGPGPAAEPGSQSRATVTPPGPDETSSWPGPGGAVVESDQSRFEQFKPEAETPAKPETTHVRMLPILFWVILGAALVVGVSMGVVWLIARGSDNGFSASAGDCVKRSGSDAVKAACSDADTFTVVSAVDTKEQCPDPGQPYVLNPTSNGKTQVLCLKPNS